MASKKSDTTPPDTTSPFVSFRHLQRESTVTLRREAVQGICGHDRGPHSVLFLVGGAQVEVQNGEAEARELLGFPALEGAEE
jgi:hypothetical protein